MADESYAFVVVSNRLPVDLVDRRGRHASVGSHRRAVSSPRSSRSCAAPTAPGSDGRVSPISTSSRSTYDGIRNVPVPLTAEELETYYEGFSNDTLWPLYHDVIAPPGYHRVWWDSYVEVNQRFADAAARGERTGRDGLGAGLPAAARSGDAPREAPRPHHRLLQPHPVPGIRHLLASCRGATRSSTGCSAPT